MNMKSLTGFANAFTLQQLEWIQLTPYGDFPHAQGLQRVDRSAAEELVRNFRAFLTRLGRGFGGMPFYIGHPDAPGMAAQFPDTKAYGWIMDLDARADGLYAKTKWSDEGATLVRQAHYKFVSPFWEAAEVADGIYRPIRLISAGLTNQPNIPVLPLSNTAAAESAPLVAQNDSQITALLDNAIRCGRIEPFEREQWQRLLAGEFDRHSTALANIAAKPTHALTANFGARKPSLMNGQYRQNRIRELVHEAMQTGLNYNSAWDAVRKTHPALFTTPLS